jgi:hypothetical protein
MCSLGLRGGGRNVRALRGLALVPGPKETAEILD